MKKFPKSGKRHPQLDCADLTDLSGMTINAHSLSLLLPDQGSFVHGYFIFICFYSASIKMETSLMMTPIRNEHKQMNCTY